jgi:hypothetical protein
MSFVIADVRPLGAAPDAPALDYLVHFGGRAVGVARVFGAVRLADDGEDIRSYIVEYLAGLEKSVGRPEMLGQLARTLAM